MWFEFSQNNSGGWFNDKVGRCVWIEADNADEANVIAENNGIYFDDDFKIDCPCCGQRWSRCYNDNGRDFPAFMFDEDYPFFKGFDTNTVFIFKTGAKMSFRYDGDYVPYDYGTSLSPEQIEMALDMVSKN